MAYTKSKYVSLTYAQPKALVERGEYIQNQQQHHTKVSWEYEFKQWLREHGI